MDFFMIIFAVIVLFELGWIRLRLDKVIKLLETKADK